MRALSLLAPLALAGLAQAGAGVADQGTESLDPIVSEVWLHRGLIAVMQRPDTRLAPFTTDGCSGGMTQVWESVAAISEGFVERHGEHPPWEDCCVTHDRAYHDAGGADDALSSQRARLRADRELKDCVVATGAHQVERLQRRYGVTSKQVLTLYGLIGENMYHAVRLGGAPCSGLSWRWGYGYPQCSPFDGD